MGVRNDGYPNYWFRELSVGSTTTTQAFPAPVEKVEITHMVGSPTYVGFDGRTLTAYGNPGSQILAVSGDKLTFNVHTGSIQLIGSTGSPIGNSTATIRVTGYY